MKAEVSASLYYSDLAVGGTSNKQYHMQIVKQGDGFVVNYQNGPLAAR